MLRGAGVNVDKKGSFIGLGVLTDKEIMKLSSGALTPPSLEKSKAFMVNAKDLKPEKGGLFDVNITGGLSGTRWAHLDLREPVVSPVFEEPVRRLLGMTKQELRNTIGDEGGEGIRKQLNKINVNDKITELQELTRVKRGAELDNVVKQLGYLMALKKQGHSKVGDAYTLSKIPVIPPIMRPILPSQRGGELQINDINYFYRDVALASQALDGAHGVGLPSMLKESRHNLYDSVSALTGLSEPTSPQLRGRQAKGLIQQLTGAGSPKTGFIHKKILKRQQDLSGRATATPDDTLNMDQIGVPEEMLWTMYSKFIMKGLINQGYRPVLARDMIEARNPSAKAILNSELLRRPVFVNRAPSLHKHNVVAAFPVPVAGKSLRINPFMEQGQNLDYDGDTMQLHVPVSEKATSEARDLTLSNLLFGDRNREHLIVFPQHESILGTYLATTDREDRAAVKFKDQGDAMSAYHKGEITLHTPVKIGK
jgi:DNA-directed RNA polymerase subunit beta'